MKLMSGDSIYVGEMNTCMGVSAEIHAVLTVYINIPSNSHTSV